jgi:hypothetical protein
VEAKARYWAVKIQPQWVVTPRKENNKPIVLLTQSLLIFQTINFTLLMIKLFAQCSIQSEGLYDMYPACIKLGLPLL